MQVLPRAVLGDPAVVALSGGSGVSWVELQEPRGHLLPCLCPGSQLGSGLRLWSQMRPQAKAVTVS